MIGFSGSWGAGDAIISGTGLSYAGFPSSGGSILVDDSTNGADANNIRNFDQSYETGTFYLSFLIKANRTNGAYQANLRLKNSGGADIARIGIQNAQIGLASNTGAFAGSTQTNDASTHLLVARIDLTSSNNDTIRLFIDPAPGDPEPATAEATLTGEFSFNGFRLFNNPVSSTQTIIEWDELRLATGWTDAVPQSN